MVLFLLLDVTTERSALRGTHGKRAITFLPRETTNTNLVVNRSRKKPPLAREARQPSGASHEDQ
jgi:hypothetical protein